MLFEHTHYHPILGGSLPTVVDPRPTFWFEGTKRRGWNGAGQSGTGQNGSDSGWNGSGWAGGTK